MRTANWKDYELIDTSAGERLERWGNVILIRPDPQIIWDTPKSNPMWREANARYLRSQTGGGNWQELKKVPSMWKINYGELTFQLKTMRAIPVPGKNMFIKYGTVKFATRF